MDEELADFVEQARSALETDPEMSARTAEVRIVQPFLSVLGWDIHGTEVVAGYATDDGVVSFALTVEDDPEILVETVAPEEDLDETHGRRLLDALRAAGADWGVLTNGRTFAFVGEASRGYDRVTVDLEDLTERTEALENYTVAAATDRHHSDRRRRRRAAERLAERRDEVVEDLTGRLREAADEDLDDAFRSATGRLLDHLIEELADTELRDRSTDADTESEDHGREEPGGEPTGSEAASDGTHESPEDEVHASTDSGTVPDDGAGAAGGDDAEEATPTGATEGSEAGGKTGDPSGAPAEPEGSDDGESEANDPSVDAPVARRPADDETEYVVRFFDGTTSVGAVGTDTTVGTLIGAVEYLDRQRAMLRRFEMPWETDDGTVVLATSETAVPGGRQLPTGHYIATDLETEGIRTAIQELASGCGLRTMFQGDW